MWFMASPGDNCFYLSFSLALRRMTTLLSAIEYTNESNDWAAPIGSLATIK